MMSIKNQIPSLSKLFFLRRNTRADKALDETYVDSYFYHKISDNSQLQPRIARVSKDSNEAFCN